MKKLIFNVILLTFIIGAVSAKAEDQERLGSVSREMSIKGTNKYKAVLLDEKVYEYANEDLSDIRITNLKGEDIPYYIENGNRENKSLKTEKIVSFVLNNEDHQTFIKINNKERLKINSITLETDEMFKRDYTVTELDAAGTETFLKSGSIYNLSLKSVKKKDTIIQLEKYTRSNEIKVSINNQDDAPLEIKQVKISYWIDKIVFAASEKETYTLWYGNKEAVSPNYDIEEYKNYIKKEEQDLCTLGELNIHEKPVSPKSQSEEGKLVFNILIMAVAGVLIIIVLKKLKNN